jgi:hydrogenase maturation protease
MSEGKIYNRPAVLVLGIGNILLHDEGIGVYVIRELQKSDIPYHVELLDGGTAGADLLDDICDRLKVIVVDAVDADIEPGTVLRIRPEDLIPSANPSVSLHDVGLAETLAMARHMNCEPKDVVIFGVKPKDISPGLGLTPETNAILPEIIDLVLAEIETFVEPVLPAK